MLFVTVLVVAALLVVAGMALLASRATPPRPDPKVLRHSLLEGYEPAPPPSETHPLRWPDGLVAVDADGISLHLGPGETDFRWVPWDRVRRVGVAEGSAVEIHVAGVGSVLAPSVVGTEIFESRARRAEF